MVTRVVAPRARLCRMTRIVVPHARSRRATHSVGPGGDATGSDDGPVDDFAHNDSGRHCHMAEPNVGNCIKTPNLPQERLSGVRSDNGGEGFAILGEPSYIGRTYVPLTLDEMSNGDKRCRESAFPYCSTYCGRVEHLDTAARERILTSGELAAFISCAKAGRLALADGLSVHDFVAPVPRDIYSPSPSCILRYSNEAMSAYPFLA
ncbi:hypothetical protein Cni_G28933 [Canna indica]|uniref:Uncharacterized protein n=1 Tax=Canna indica TaxID=4628 RepID=A0AAQ3QSR8_9LILI|nr:hypothetical protein Cni_G28933 [Canna indica]